MLGFKHIDVVLHFQLWLFVGFLLYHADHAIKKQQILIYILGITLFGDLIRPSSSFWFFSQHFIAYGRWRDCNLAARWNIWMREIKRIGQRWEDRAERRKHRQKERIAEMDGTRENDGRWEKRRGSSEQRGGQVKESAVQMQSSWSRCSCSGILHSPPCWSPSLTPDIFSSLFPPHHHHLQSYYHLHLHNLSYLAPLLYVYWPYHIVTHIIFNVKIVLWSYFILYVYVCVCGGGGGGHIQKAFMPLEWHIASSNTFRNWKLCNNI